MSRLLIVHAVALLVAAMLSPACESSSGPPPREVVTATRPVGSWQGRGNRTIGLVSDSGQFRISWQTRNEDPPRSGTFRLTVHSAVSGRPIQVVADHQGDGSGTADVADDPRPYHLMVDSANIEWSISVEEVVASYAKPPS